MIVPAATLFDYPTILDYDAPKLYGYSRESTVAEKFEAMVALGQVNSRTRDFFDVWLLSQQFDFDGPLLARAIEATFAHRGTKVRPDPVALTTEFAGDPAKARQWIGFLDKSRIDFAPSALREVIDAIAGFVGPVANAIASDEPFALNWPASGPWK